jgi:hypothetical protein
MLCITYLSVCIQRLTISVDPLHRATFSFHILKVGILLSCYPHFENVGLRYSLIFRIHGVATEL